MADAQVEIIRVYGPNPSIDPAPDDVGVEILAGSSWVGVVDSPVSAGASNIPIPPVGENRGIFAHLALRIVVPASPVTTISAVGFFLSQASINALGGAWDGCKIYTPASDQDPADLDLFVPTGGTMGEKTADYNEATRTLGVQGYLGDDIEAVYTAITAVEDLFAFPQLPRLDLTGLGRADGTTATFGQSANDVSRAFIIQPVVTADALRGLKPLVSVSCRYDELV